MGFVIPRPLWNLSLLHNTCMWTAWGLECGPHTTDTLIIMVKHLKAINWLFALFLGDLSWSKHNQPLFTDHTCLQLQISLICWRRSGKSKCYWWLWKRQLLHQLSSSDRCKLSNKYTNPAYRHWLLQAKVDSPSQPLLFHEKTLMRTSTRTRNMYKS